MTTSIGLIRAATVTAVGGVREIGAPMALQAWLQGADDPPTNACAATVTVYGSCDPRAKTTVTGIAKTLLATFNLSGDGSGAGVAIDTAEQSITVPYPWVWAEVTAISGDGATVYVAAGV